MKIGCRRTRREWSLLEHRSEHQCNVIGVAREPLRLLTMIYVCLKGHDDHHTTFGWQNKMDLHIWALSICNASFYCDTDLYRYISFTPETSCRTLAFKRQIKDTG